MIKTFGFLVFTNGVSHRPQYLEHFGRTVECRLMRATIVLTVMFGGGLLLASCCSPALLAFRQLLQIGGLVLAVG